MQAVIGMLQDTIEQNPIDQKRVYLTGLSMGGYGSWDLAERMPQRFAALAPVCGGGDETKADRLAALPIWAWHGDADTAVPVERSRRMIAAIERRRQAEIHRATRRRPRQLDAGLPRAGQLARLAVRTDETGQRQIAPWRLAAGADLPHARIILR